MRIVHVAISKAKPGMEWRLPYANFTIRPSSTRGTIDQGWLISHCTLSFAGYFDGRFPSFGCLLVLNEDRLAPGYGFTNYPRFDSEIFSYVFSGELAQLQINIEEEPEDAISVDPDRFSRVGRGDVQLTTVHSGIGLAARNLHTRAVVHSLEIWVTPWRWKVPRKSLKISFDTADLRRGFVTMISPLKAGPQAVAAEEEAAIPTREGTIPVHADILMAAAIIAPGSTFLWIIGLGGSTEADARERRKLYVQLPLSEDGGAMVRIAWRREFTLDEGDGVSIEDVNFGEVLAVESIGEKEAEVVIFDLK